jgi:uncharacterized membrane protein YccC
MKMLMKLIKNIRAYFRRKDQKIKKLGSELATLRIRHTQLANEKHEALGENIRLMKRQHEMVGEYNTLQTIKEQEYKLLSDDQLQTIDQNIELHNENDALLAALNHGEMTNELLRARVKSGEAEILLLEREISDGQTSTENIE